MNRSQFYNVNLEMEILSIAFNDNKTVDTIMELKEDIFYFEKHKNIFSIMKSLWMDSQEITMATILAYVKNDLESIGGVSFLGDIYCLYTTSRGLNQLIDTLKAYRKRREILNVKNELDKMLQEEKENEVILSTLSASLSEIEDNSEDDGEIAPALDECLTVLESKYNNGGKVTGIQTKLVGLDKRLNGLNKQELFIVAGRPGSGKTTFANNIALRSASQGYNTIVFNLEMSKVQIFQKLIANVGVIDNEKLKFGNLNDAEWERVGNAQSKLLNMSKNLKIFDSLMHIDKIIAQCNKLHKKGKLDLVIIDYLQLIETNGNKNSREQEVSSISRRLKQLSKNLQIPVIVLSQLSRACEQRADKRPILSDLRESGAIEQDADNVLFCYRDEYYYPDTEDKGILEIIIGKQRNGPTGTEKVAWIPEYQKITDTMR